MNIRILDRRYEKKYTNFKSLSFAEEAKGDEEKSIRENVKFIRKI